MPKIKSVTPQPQYIVRSVAMRIVNACYDAIRSHQTDRVYDKQSPSVKQYTTPYTV